MSVLISREAGGSVHVATLNRPERLNALNRETVAQLHESIAVAAREGARSWCLNGAGRSFCAGFDMRQEISERESTEQLAQMQRLTGALRAAPFVSVVSLHGHVVGGGFELAMACDVAVAARDAVMMFPDVNNAFAVGGGATFYLPRMVGLPRARYLLLSGEPVSGAEAHAAGLVALVSETAEEAVTAGLAVARRLAQAPAEALNTIRRAIDRGVSGTLDTALDAELADQLMTFHSAEGRGTVAGFRSTAN